MLSVLALMILGFALFIAGSLIVYVIVYNHRIKKRLATGEVGGRQWPAPKNVLLVVLSIAVVIAITITVISVIYARENEETPSTGGSVLVENDNPKACQTQFIRSEDLPYTSEAVYMDAYTTGELVGFTKEERTEGDFRYMLFMNGDTRNSLQPDFILFVEYIGEEDFEKVVEYNYMESSLGGGSASGECNKVSDYYFFAGNGSLYTSNCTESIGLYKSEDAALQDLENGDLTNADAYIDIYIPLD